MLSFIKWVLGFCCGVWFLGMFLASGVAVRAGAAHRAESTCLGKGETRGMISVLLCHCHSQSGLFSKVFQVGTDSKYSSFSTEFRGNSMAAEGPTMDQKPQL